MGLVHFMTPHNHILTVIQGAYVRTQSSSYFISLFRRFSYTTLRCKYSNFLKEFHTVMFMNRQVSGLLMLTAIDT